MSVSANPYALNDYEAVPLLTDDSREEDVTVAGLTNVTIEAEWQTMERLYTADTTVAEADLQAEKNVPVTIEFMKLKGDFHKEWLGGEGTSDTAWADTTSPQEFKIDGADFRSKDGVEKAEVTVEGITFGSIPIVELSENEYGAWSIEGQGKDITNFDVSTVA
jgi:hypothetical protein